VRKTLKKDAVPSKFEHCEGWDNINDRHRHQPRKPPMDRSSIPPEKVCSRMENEESDIILPAAASPSSTSKTELMEQEISDYKLKLAQYEEEIAKRDVQLKNLQQRLHIERWGINRFTNDDQKIKFYTGFISYKLFIKFYEAVKPSAENMTSAYYCRSGDKRTLAGRPRTMLLIDELFMLLMRLRQNFPEQDLAERFRITESSVSRKLLTWISLLYIILGSIPIWISKEEIKRTMPKCFKSLYPTTRVIIDCTEIPTQYASSLVLNSQLYSNYKSRPTFKCLVVVAPSGSFTFISHLFCGSMSDIAIIKMSGFLDLLEKDDSVMADKGFKIGKLLEGKGVALNLPPFLANMQQFTPEQVKETEEIASVRIHVERAIGRVKEYRIFDKVPLSMMGSINQLWVIACILSNFQLPLIKDL
jgi:hypothetical protein